MNNILNYLEWRGDLSFENDPLNEVDNLIFSILAYFNYEGIVPNPWQDGSISLSEVGKLVENWKGKQTKNRSADFEKGIHELLVSASLVPRFQSVSLSHYTNVIDLQRAKQFSAILFSLNKNLHFIAFRGTDGTLAGWKEDFHMSFLDQVPAQISAASYTGNIIIEKPGMFFLGGHSKGGNLAVSAAGNLPLSLQKYIIRVFNNDGPGFLESMTQSKGYKRILPRVRTFIPESSIVGMLLEHSEEYVVIGSSEKLLLQHDPFSWYVEGPHFLHEQGLNEKNGEFNKYIRTWLMQIPIDQREKFVDTVFTVIQSSGINRFDELSEDRLQKIKSMINSIKGMDSESKRNVLKTIEIFFTENKQAIKTNIRRDLVGIGNKKLNKS
jgi:hypothetical protein